MSAGTKPGRGDLPGMLALLLLAVLVLGPGNGSARPLEDHEIYVARTASEMLARDDLLVPYFNDLPRLKKPPLSYWLAAGAHLALGDGSDRVSEFEARLPSVLAGLGLVLLTVALGRAAFESPELGRRIGWLAGLLVATSNGLFEFGHSARPEMVYAACCALELLGFLRLRRASDRAGRLAAGSIAWGGFALGVLAKGPNLPLFLLLGVVAGHLCSRPRPRLREVLQPGLGLAIVLPVGLAYFGAVAARVEGAVELWTSELTQDVAREGTPFLLRPLRLYFFGAALWLMMPWVAPAWRAVRLTWSERRPGPRVLACSVLASLVILSFSRKLRLHYVLPLLPALGVLLSWALIELHDRLGSDEAGLRRRARWITAHALIVLLLAAVVVAAAFDAAPGDPGTSLPAVLPGVAAALLLVGYGWRQRRAAAARGFAALVLAVGALLAGLTTSGVAWSPKRVTEADFARRVAELVPAGAELYFEDGSLPMLVYYSGRRVRSRAEASESSAASYVVTVPARATGSELARERELPGEEPMVLQLIPASEPAPR